VNDQLPTIDPLGASNADAVLLDVREHDEYKAGHAAGVVHVPMGEIGHRLGELPPGRRVICICRSGGRSAQVTAFLLEHGIDALNMTGGMQGWHAAGLPLVTDDGLAGYVA
jgi:rhodanese-related sulfurtransferase